MSERGPKGPSGPQKPNRDPPIILPCSPFEVNSLLQSVTALCARAKGRSIGPVLSERRGRFRVCCRIGGFGLVEVVSMSSVLEQRKEGAISPRNP